MKKIINIALGMAGMLFLTTLPAYSTTIALNIGPNGTYSGTSGSFELTSLVETETVAGGATYTQTINLNDELILSFNTASGSQSLSIATTATASPFTNILTSTSVYNAGTNLPNFSGTMNSSVLAETITSDPTAVAALVAAFATDIALPSGATFTVSGGITGSSGAVKSDTLDLNTSSNFATPEPSTNVLLGAGLLAVAALVRKRKPGIV